MYSHIKDKEVLDLLIGETKRQEEVLEMIPSENYASKAVKSAVGSIFMDKYAEGLPGKRYYQGNEFVDKLERLAITRAKDLFGVEHVNVQPLSGGPANLAIIRAICDPDDIQLAQHLSTGGHLSMGQDANVSKLLARPIFYHLDKDGEIDWEQLERLAVENRPKLIWSGGTGYTRIFDWRRYREIADKVGAYFVADISHIGGLVAGGAHPSPVGYAHVVMTTTHKTLRGPRGAIIMVTKDGIEKDLELGNKIDKAVFPGLQGGPHMEIVAGMAVAFEEASQKEFGEYAHQVVKNAQALARKLVERGYNLVGKGTQNHMLWIDLTNKGVDGWTAAWGLEAAGIVANRQTIPGEKGSAYYPSGLRLGTPAITTRGMREKEMELIGELFDKVMVICRQLVGSEYRDVGSDNRDLDQLARKKFKKEVFEVAELVAIREEVKSLCARFKMD